MALFRSVLGRSGKAVMSYGMPKVVVIGAGSSSFGPAMLFDLMSNAYPSGGTLSLADIDPSALSLMEAVAHKMRATLNVDIRIEAAVDRTEVLSGADAVLIAAEQDRLGRWRLDWEIPLRFGIKHTLGENRGPAGLSHTLRTAPLVLDVCRDVERISPGATVIILTNPEDRLAYAASKFTGLDVIGCCDGLWDFKQNHVGKLLGLPGDRVYVEGAGINHAVWVTTLRDRKTGQDLYPALVEAARKTGWQPLGLHLYETYGLWPHENDEHYGEYIHYAHEYVGCQGYNFERRIAYVEKWRQRLKGLVDGSYEEERFIAEVRELAQGVFGDNPPSNIIAGVFLGRPTFLPNANIRNDGRIPGLPDEMIVEVPAVATPSGVHGIRTQRLPRGIMSFLYREGTIQMLAAEAAVEGSRAKALEALDLDPQVPSPAVAEELLDAFLDAHRDLIPVPLWHGLKGLPSPA